MRPMFVFILCIFTMASLAAQQLSPKLYWDFSEIKDRNVVEKQSGIVDTLEGYFKSADGIVGNGLRLDGFTACLKHRDRDLPAPGDEFTVEAWIALANYPWNWCPILTTETNETRGYRLMAGPHGEISLQVASGEQWISCTTERLVIPLREWMHVTGVYRAEKDLAVYINGELMATMPIQGRMGYAGNCDVLIGMVAHPQKPSDIHRTWGTLPQYFGLTGIIDEVKVYYGAVVDKAIFTAFKSRKLIKPDIQAHRLPDIEKHPGRFGAFYTKLKYYDAWDNLWPVEQDPDIVVCFDKLPVKVIFWRGIRYGTSWVSENNLWMSDQSVEAWAHGADDREGCFEHMQDRHCRFSHVRIIENNPARVVVHWRYAPVSAYNNTWRIDPRTGWECWIDEYHFIYPDAAGIRKVSWKKETLKHPRQFQESLPILQPGQVISDVVHRDNVHVSDYDGNIRPVSYVEDPGGMDREFARNYTVQQYNFKSKNKPFICFEPGNNMSVRWGNIKGYDRHGGCNHFPVGQARCDGRTSTTSDRPSHFNGFPISYPPINEKGDRYFWNGLYGINERSMEEVVHLGKSWAYAAELTVVSGEFVSHGYDKSERCYQLENNLEKPQKLTFTLAGSEKNPICNPAFFIKNWNAEGATVLINGKPAKDARWGINHELDGDNLVIFLFIEKEDAVEVMVKPI